STSARRLAGLPPREPRPYLCHHYRPAVGPTQGDWMVVAVCATGRGPWWRSMLIYASATRHGQGDESDRHDETEITTIRRAEEVTWPVCRGHAKTLVGSSILPRERHTSTCHFRLIGRLSPAHYGQGRARQSGPSTYEEGTEVDGSPDFLTSGCSHIYGKKEAMLAVLVHQNFFTPSSVQESKVTYIPGAGIEIPRVNWTDFGTYTVKSFVYVSYTDSPVLADGRLVANVRPEPILDSTTGRLHVQLTCGHFLTVGSRPVAVAWMAEDIEDQYRNITSEMDRLAKITETLLARTEEVVADNAMLKTQTEELKSANENLTSANGRLEFQLQRLASDMSEEKALVEGFTTQMNSVNAEVNSLKSRTGKRVAFLARLSEANVQANIPVLFKAVVFNMGSAFDPNTGVFTITHAGVYIISFQMFPTYGGDVLVDLYKNGNIEVRMRVYDVSWSTSEASSVTQHCQPRDRYWVQVHRGGTMHFGVHSFFSASLISADE
ncbi:hypothetical protein BaRGS_00010924, partial [Batillaria attramentaria]